ncbi:uncharacterized protein LOC114354202 [Ostrinia furnacalis]|uniref:uncharacterized protein LOC114354202 n=1 Tax=Ostrinia furnacalis TaxID=93504 RepID=UPI00103B747A|nr:uncharacterized protein LOC114354202 [Ostrinia furnacalis]
MDIQDEPEILKRCYKCDHQLFDSINIVYNASNSMIVIWNKYQIFVYEDLNFESTAKVFMPEFQIQQLILSNNYLICLDKSGNIHTTSMKFKNPAQKRFKSSFQPKEQGIMICIQTQDDHSSSILSVKCENDLYSLCLNKINSEFTLEKKIALLHSGRWPLPTAIQDKCIIAIHKLSETEFDYVKKIFDVNSNYIVNDYSLIIMSFDKLSVYGCLFSPKMPDEAVNLVKLYTCPSEICNIEITEINNLFILIGLNIGTLVRLNLRNVSNKPELVHLNSALYKFLTLKDTVLYTDAKSMWKTDNTFTENISFFQFFVKDVKDFIKFGDQIICTTFTNLIYIFPIDDESSYIKPITTDEYCAAEKLLNNSEYLYKIIEELEKNNTLTKKINEEGNFVTAFSLSNRQDIMDNIIHHTITVYEYYQDVIHEHPGLMATEELYKYSLPDTFFILINLSTTTLQHMFNNILSNVLNDVKIHISLSMDGKLLKTTSMKVTDTFKKLKVLMPVTIQDENISEMDVNMELVTSVPGAFEEKQKLWVTLYRRRVVLTSEHFIQSAVPNTDYPPKRETNIEKLAWNFTQDYYQEMVKVTNLMKLDSVPKFSIYLKLPNNFAELLKKNADHLSYLTKMRAEQIVQNYSSEEFLKSNSPITFEVGSNSVAVEIVSDDFSKPLLKFSCGNMTVAHDIRSLFSKIIYDDFKNSGPGQEFVKHALYYEAEKVLKKIKSCIQNKPHFKDFQPVADEFEKNIIGALPI